MEKWKQIAALLLVALGLVGLSYAYGRQLGNELLAQLEIDALERIPVLDEEPV